RSFRGWCPELSRGARPCFGARQPELGYDNHASPARDFWPVLAPRHRQGSVACQFVAPRQGRKNKAKPTWHKPRDISGLSWFSPAIARFKRALAQLYLVRRNLI